jgi:branched-subunit amino acid aminotransferase/4-amino-4-deoxychorismate lyase
MAVEERSLSPAELEQAREILLTNSLFEIRSVMRLNHRDLSGGDGLAKKLRNAYRALAAK